MRDVMQQVFMIGGPNGAGKTTSATTLLPELLQCDEYINADAIAAALSPFHPESIAIQAGRLMLERIHHLSEQKKNFAFETTMASRSFASYLKNCKDLGYKINLLFLWLQSPELAVQRVASRVENGGHNVPEEDIRRRYQRGIKNFINIYIPLADQWVFCDNSNEKPHVIAENNNSQIIIYDVKQWEEAQKGAVK